jgi:hypothetical protein
VVAPSDIRLKQNIQLLSAKETLPKLMQLQPVEHYLKQVETPADSVTSQGDTVHYMAKRYDENTSFFQQKRYGLIAQELQKVYPELVHVGSDGYLGVDYTSLVPLLLQAIQEQQKQIDYLMLIINKENVATATDASFKK